MIEQKPTGYNLLGFALWNLNLVKRLILVEGWVERSETQHIRAGSTQPTRNQGLRSASNYSIYFNNALSGNAQKML